MNINPAFGTFTETTTRELIRPMFSDLVSLTAAEAIGQPLREGGFCCIRQPEAAGWGPGPRSSPPTTMPWEAAAGGAAGGGTARQGAAGRGAAGKSGDRAAGDFAAGGGAGAAPDLARAGAGGSGSSLSAGSESGAGVDELSAHMAYLAFKSSHRKKYEKKQGAESAKPLWRTPLAVEDSAAEATV